MRPLAIACGWLLSVAMALPAVAQDIPLRQAAGTSEVSYSPLETVPPDLRAAIGTACDYTSHLAEFPIRVIYPRQNRTIILVPCSGVVGWGLAFKMARRTPVPIEFAVLSPPQGVGVTRNPGFLAWTGDTLTATQSSDMIPSDQWRHSYRFSGDAQPFVLMRVDRRTRNANGVSEPWQLYWDASVAAPK